jgi:hypothetical protein
MMRKAGRKAIVIERSSMNALPLTMTYKESKTLTCQQERLMQCCSQPMICVLSFHFCGYKPGGGGGGVLK